VFSFCPFQENREARMGADPSSHARLLRNTLSVRSLAEHGRLKKIKVFEGTFLSRKRAKSVIPSIPSAVRKLQYIDQDGPGFYIWRCL
jgi:hypothetical protein